MICTRGVERMARCRDAVTRGVEERATSGTGDWERCAPGGSVSDARASGMIRPSSTAVVYVCVSATDMRKQAASLALLVEQGLKRDVFAPALYVFSNARRDRIRILYWERNGLVLWSKRLDRQRFIWLQITDSDTVSMTGEQVNQLLDRFDVWAQAHREIPLTRVG